MSRGPGQTRQLLGSAEMAASELALRGTRAQIDNEELCASTISRLRNGRTRLNGGNAHTCPALSHLKINGQPIEDGSGNRMHWRISGIADPAHENSWM